MRRGARVRCRTHLGTVKRLLRTEHDGLPVLQVDVELAFEHEQELVGVVVLVPVELTLDHAEADHRVVDRGQRLVEPGFVLGGFRGDVDERECPNLSSRWMSYGGSAGVMVSTLQVRSADGVE